MKKSNRRIRICIDLQEGEPHLLNISKENPQPLEEIRSKEKEKQDFAELFSS